MVVHALLIAAALAPSNTRWEAGVATSYVRGGSCTAIGGPAVFDMPLLFALGSTLDYRW